MRNISIKDPAEVRGAGPVRRGVAVLSCLVVLGLAACSGAGEGQDDASGTSSRESSSPSGPQDPRLQGEPLTEEQQREELCDQVVRYFPDEMVTGASTSVRDPDGFPGCGVDNVHVDPNVTVEFEISASALSLIASLESIDAKLLSDDPMCQKVALSADMHGFDEDRDATSYGKRPDEFCGLRFAGEGHMTGRFIENAQNLFIEMWVDAPDSVEQYDVREEIMPYIMEGTRKFHSDH